MAGLQGLPTCVPGTAGPDPAVMRAGAPSLEAPSGSPSLRNGFCMSMLGGRFIVESRCGASTRMRSHSRAGQSQVHDCSLPEPHLHSLRLLL